MKSIESIENIANDYLASLHIRHWFYKEACISGLVVTVFLFLLTIFINPEVSVLFLFLIPLFFVMATGSFLMEKNPFVIPSLMSFVLVLELVLELVKLFQFIYYLIPSIESILIFILFFIIVMFQIIPLYLIIDGVKVQNEINNKYKFLISDHWGKYNTITIFVRALNIFKTTYKNKITGKDVLSIFFSLISFLFFSIAVVILVGSDFFSNSPPNLIEVKPINIKVGAMLGLGGLSVGIVITSILIASIFKRVSQKISINTLVNKDLKGNPILYLRPFNQDNSFFKYNNSVINFLLFIRGKKNIDRIMLEECITSLPIVSIGDPSENIKSYGLPKYYCKDEHWKKTVGELIANSEIIYMFLQKTDGTYWEINKISEMNCIEKTIYVVPPSIQLKDIQECVDLIFRDYDCTYNYGELERIKSNISRNSYIAFFFHKDRLFLFNGVERGWENYLTMIRSSLRIKMSKTYPVPDKVTGKYS